MESRIELKLKKLKLRYTPADINKLLADFETLKQHDLSEISDRLLSTNKSQKFMECLTEVNFTSQLLNSLPDHLKLDIQYEPNEGKRPIDLVIVYNSKKYFLQIKSLSESIRDSKQSQILRGNKEAG